MKLGDKFIKNQDECKCQYNFVDFGQFIYVGKPTYLYCPKSTLISFAYMSHTGISLFVICKILHLVFQTI